MGMSSGNRRLVTELAGVAVVMVVGAIALLNFKTVTSYARKAAGLPADGLALKSPGKHAERPPASDSNSKGRVIELRAGAHGHFHTAAEINGRSINLMVDTGASIVALTYEDAARAGITPRESEYTQQVSTANGIARVAPVMLDKIAIGDVVVRNVAAAIAEPGKLNTTLLGMSFLGRLNRVDMRAGRLILEE
jgi:aspartyl protease family protein